MLANTKILSKMHLNAIATRALLDEEFITGILNGSRLQQISEYPLPDRILQEIMNIRAADVGQFILGLYAIITRQSDPEAGYSRD